MKHTLLGVLCKRLHRYASSSSWHRPLDHCDNCLEGSLLPQNRSSGVEDILAILYNCPPVSLIAESHVYRNETGHHPQGAIHCPEGRGRHRWRKVSARSLR